MTFDWLTFLKQNSIPYSTGARNMRGNVGISCPWCGSTGDGVTDRLGISTAGLGWRCWKNPEEHKGRAPHRLIMALLGCSYNEAAGIAGHGGESMEDIPDWRLGAEIEKIMRGGPTSQKAGRTEFPPGIPQIRSVSGLSQSPFVKYLRGRGYQSDQEVLRLANQYGLRCAIRGPFAYRVVFPIVHPEGLVGWTGRTITKTDHVRYKTLSADPEKARAQGLPVAVLKTDESLWNYDHVSTCECRTLVVCEGPFDAMRVDWLGRPRGIAATCVFKKHVSDQQAELLAAVRPKFERAFLMLDPDAWADSIGAMDRLRFLDLLPGPRLPEGIEDPAMMSEKLVHTMFE